MKLNKKLELGIKVIDLLRDREKPAHLSDLAPQVGTTTNFLGQIMRDLRTAGIVSVKRGPNGGYFLGQDVTISAYHVAKAVGRDFGTLSLDPSSLSRLNKAIIEAYVNTEIFPK